MHTTHRTHEIRSSSGSRSTHQWRKREFAIRIANFEFTKQSFVQVTHVHVNIYTGLVYSNVKSSKRCSVRRCTTCDRSLVIRFETKGIFCQSHVYSMIDIAPYVNKTEIVANLQNQRIFKLHFIIYSLGNLNPVSELQNIF